MNAPDSFHVPDGTGVDLRSAERRDEFAIGQILIDAGYLDIEAAETVARVQRQNGLSFGEAALRLKMLAPDAIEFALARQFEFPQQAADDASISKSVIAAYEKTGAFIEQMRFLRTRLMLYRAANPRLPATIAVTSDAHGEGRSFVAANLAVLFAQLGERTLLIDADMRRPTQHELFNTSRLGLSNVLLGRVDRKCFNKVTSFFDLQVLAAGSPPPNPQELLSRVRMQHLLREAADDFDVVIVDTPPLSSYSDGLIVASHAGMSLLVIKRKETDQRSLARCRKAMVESGANLVGVVLNT